jgi:hypothetical protein
MHEKAALHTLQTLPSSVRPAIEFGAGVACDVALPQHFAIQCPSEKRFEFSLMRKIPIMGTGI